MASTQRPLRVRSQGLVLFSPPFSSCLELPGLCKKASTLQTFGAQHHWAHSNLVAILNVSGIDRSFIRGSDLVFPSRSHPDLAIIVTLCPSVFLRLLCLAKFLRLNSFCVPDTPSLICVAENATSCSVPYTRSSKGTIMFLRLHFCIVPETTISWGVPDNMSLQCSGMYQKELVNFEIEVFMFYPSSWGIWNDRYENSRAAAGFLRWKPKVRGLANWIFFLSGRPETR